MTYVVAGIGSRQTPDHITRLFRDIGAAVCRAGGWVRSGHASGADLGWESGGGQRCVAYLPYPTFNQHATITAGFVVTLPGRNARSEPFPINWRLPDPVAVDRAEASVAQHHPAGAGLDMNKFGAYHMRNYFIVMGSKAQERPADLLICYARPTCEAPGIEDPTHRTQPSTLDVRGGTGQAVRIAHARRIPVFNFYYQSPSLVGEWLDKCIGINPFPPWNAQGGRT